MAGQETVVAPRETSVYAEPRTVTDLEDCYFYHSMELPGYGLVEGPWDLRGGVDDYLGGVDLRDKRVLEVGTASGFLCFTMEGRGADVVAYDLSDKQSWDVVPYAQYDHESFDSERREHLRKLNNSWWLAHRAFESSAKVVYGTVYEIPEEIGRVDVATYGNVLRHFRDPFLALERGLRLTTETAIVTENPSLRYSLPQMAASLLKPNMAFLPITSASSRANRGGTSRRRPSSRCSASSVSRTRRSSTTYSASRGGATRSSRSSGAARVH